MTVEHQDRIGEQAPAPAKGRPTTDAWVVAECLRSIGRGREGARGMAVAAARRLFDAVFAGRVSELELGALLIALRMERETAAEVEGALQALAAHLDPVPVDPARPAVSFPSYHGARHQPNLTPLLACLLADAGVQVIVHGMPEDPRRTTTWQVMSAMGLAPLRHVGDAPDHLSRSDPVFVPVDILSPALARLLAIRSRLGLRTIGHTLVKVLNPSTAAGCLRLSACAQAEGGRLLHEVFVRTQASALVLRGTEGEAVADARVHTRIDWLHEGRCTVLADAEPLPPGARPSLPPAHDARATARWIQSVLAGERPVPAAIDAQFDCVMRALSRSAV